MKISHPGYCDQSCHNDRYYRGIIDRLLEDVFCCFQTQSAALQLAWPLQWQLKVRLVWVIDKVEVKL